MQKIGQILSKINHIIPVDYVFAGLFTAFCISGSFSQLAVGSFDATDINSVTKVNVLLFWCVFAFCDLGLFLPVCCFKKKEYVPRALLISVVIFGCVTTAFNSENIFLIIGFALISFFAVYWSIDKNKIALYNTELTDKSLYASVFCLAAFAGIIIFATAYFRYKSFSAQNFDFGIFASMFENMKKTGLPMTTCERNVLMSHFGVHFSPFFYLLLPIYLVFSSPVTLIALQTLFVIAGVVPLVMICRHLKLQNIVTLTMSVVYLLFPGFVGGAINDFHENAFLTFIILFLVYFMLKKKNVLFFFFLVLLFSVKEDAAIYAFAIGLFMLFYQKEYIKSSVVIFLSIVYFFCASAMVEALNVLNTGAMTERFLNYMPNGENSLLSVIYTCFYDFPYLISQVVTSEKLLFLLWVLIPVGFIPFMSKRKSLLLLMLPLLVVNLMSNWQYQFDIGYHYTFGTGALIIFGCVLVLSEKTNRQKAMLGIFCAMMSVIMCTSVAVPRLAFIPYYCTRTEKFSEMDEFIGKLDKKQDYTATSTLIPHMYEFSQVYAYPNYYGEQSTATEYFVAREEDFTVNENLEKYIAQNNYEPVSSEYGMVLYKQK